jgi:LAO/AO transport system kinase
LLAGDRRAVARLISLVENGAPEAREALAALYPHTGRAHIVGITGSPGSGKSTLVNQMAKAFRRQETTIGIVAVDPTSPFSGGAILGDRIRMQDHCGDPGVFIRSMATRGALGGLARATSDVVKVLDAFGKDVILVETVGVGQDEVEIAKAAHTTIVVEAPGMGDDIQALKAGVMEIADILVVNKADREGADRTVAALEMMLDLKGQADCGWQTPVLKTVATLDEGTTVLVDATIRHRQFLRQSGNLALRERERVDRELADLVQERLRALLLAVVAPGEIDAIVDGIVSRRLDPYAAADALAKRLR